ncbi:MULTISPECIES: ester cyclase [Rhizobium/Agrobacterium group]|uniref:ester cyclase n=1 Tax=Rhizobium/Agrobacterium group TaxID=227290 RepID=UPI001F37797A|nr:MULTISPECIES: ester cyclase [Rhizobium/Agrobacterium group]
MVEDVQVGGDFEVFDLLMDPGFVDHTPSPGFPPTRDGARELYHGFRKAFPDMTATIEFQLAEGDLVTTRKIYFATHKGAFLGIEPTGRSITFDVIDVLKVQGDVITDHRGVMNIAKLLAQIS